MIPDPPEPWGPPPAKPRLPPLVRVREDEPPPGYDGEPLPDGFALGLAFLLGIAAGAGVVLSILG